MYVGTPRVGSRQMSQTPRRIVASFSFRLCNSYICSISYYFDTGGISWYISRTGKVSHTPRRYLGGHSSECQFLLFEFEIGNSTKLSECTLSPCSQQLSGYGDDSLPITTAAPIMYYVRTTSFSSDIQERAGAIKSGVRSPAFVRRSLQLQKIKPHSRGALSGSPRELSERPELRRSSTLLRLGLFTLRNVLDCFSYLVAFEDGDID